MVFSLTTVMEIFRGLHTLINRSSNTLVPSIGKFRCNKYQKFDITYIRLIVIETNVIYCKTQSKVLSFFKSQTKYFSKALEILLQDMNACVHLNSTLSS